ncbi:calpain-9 isoform X2 [Mus musculus]|uniref:calpain-9 isoform X2 n=1 Tax=Mus musculus TaxID=10090 RepID=UPI0003D7410D|nr:calpain-9 isoform X2 [Mus musculus]|eukprot:XP_006531468.1 PREDICTED: calpain-9 isoform X2 [Mus musculus]
MPYLHRSLRPQPQPVPGDARTIHSSGQSFEQLRQGCLQSGTLFEDADFPASNVSLFYSERPQVPFVWKRPGEIVEKPEFILGGATRTDICQGELGDCWLLAAIASLTLNQKALTRVVPQDQGFGSGYAGIFHFQFWQHSEWLDVVIDDRLPTFKDRLVFLHSADHNEFWSALLEKAYANSPEWRSVDLEEQKRLGHTALDDGEFWMAFKDFKIHFDKVEICNLTPDALEDSALHRWEVTIHQGSWVRGSTAGGCRNFLDTFWTNPQIKLSLTERDEGQEGCTFLAALMQKDRRRLKRFGANMLTIGYAIYQCPDKDGHLSRDFFRYHASLARSKTFINLREVSERFQLPPGDYILIPSTFEPHQEADFCLRIFSEKRAVTRDLDENIDIDLPELPKPTPQEEETEEEQQFRALFQRVAGEDMEVSAEELEYVLNAVLQKKTALKFKRLSLLSCRNIISLMDTSGNGKLEFEEFRVFWDKLKHWMKAAVTPGQLPAATGPWALTSPCSTPWSQDLFLQFDVDKSGTMSSYELRTALKAAGFQLGGHLLQLIVLRYADEDLQLDFDDYLNCLVRLENASRVFQSLSVKNKDFIHLNINEFISLTMNI